MKRIFIILAAAAFTVSFAGCAKKADGNKGSAGNEVIIYSPLPQAMITSMLSKFEADTGIKTECLAMGTGDALKRIETEANAPQADILWAGTIGLVKDKARFFADYTCANEDAFYPQYKNVEGNLTRFNTIPEIIMINKNLIGDIKIKGYADLLNPALKGRIAFADPQAASTSFEHIVNMLYAMGGEHPDNGWDFVRQFAKQLAPWPNVSVRKTVRRLVCGVQGRCRRRICGRADI